MGRHSSSETLERNLDESPFLARVTGDDGHYYECEECNFGGQLLCCDSCPRTYHLKCLNPPLKRVPEGKWHCPICANEQGLLLGHEVPLDGALKVDRILGCRLKCNDTTSEQSCKAKGKKPLEDTKKDTYEFLIKWVGKSNIHNTWVPESQLKIIARRKLENYQAKNGYALINICKEQSSQPHRILSLQAASEGQEEVLVKWCGQTYDECTWESVNEPVIKNSSHLIDQFKTFESEAIEKDAGRGSRRETGDGQELNLLLEQPAELKGGKLFPHQLEALNWLRKCWYRSTNVILADEMGLGKTVSATAFLSALYCEFKVRLPSLILVPLSTLPNWLAEFLLWAPHLNVVEYHGGVKARAIIRQYEWHATASPKPTNSYKFNVLLTTYEMVLADASYLRNVPLEVLIVDEGHRLKNSSSKLFRLLNTFSFQHRVLLTGTPLQNNIGEMYNLLNFLQPTSFPSLSAFEEKFNDLSTAEKVDELKKLVAPHMLRRLKKDAMQNIPPKTERVVPVELSSIQAEYYRALLTKNYQVLRNIGRGAGGSGGAQKQSLLNIVMQLRKVCNHPYLIAGTEPESGTPEFLHEMRIKASAKLTLLHMMLKILRKAGHRVLIFSQMTKLMDILEDYLLYEFGSETYERVDGSVSVAERQAAIARFNKDKTRFVFLLSTRSCGLGINLATADTVIIYDSDFNPHADIQAMNRAHRIGQANQLLVYRLVVRASVEERILQLAKKKLMLDQLFVNKSGSQKEVEDILRWGTEELFREAEGSPSDNNGEGVTEHRHKRRVGRLGDVYEDRCAGLGNTKLVWDDNTIAKLLNRSDVQSGMQESTDVDMESDMLGSVKAMDWSEETNEEPTTANSTADTAGEGSKDKNITECEEENEWDKLLRVSWEKSQIDEEASLGRGKRQRKAVSYGQTFSSIFAENLSESSEEECEYSAAGRARKEKYAKRRARQKERVALSQRYMVVPAPTPPSVEELQAGEMAIAPPLPKPIPSTAPNAPQEKSTSTLREPTPHRREVLQQPAFGLGLDQPVDPEIHLRTGKERRDLPGSVSGDMFQAHLSNFAPHSSFPFVAEPFPPAGPSITSSSSGGASSLKSNNLPHWMQDVVSVPPPLPPLPPVPTGPMLPPATLSLSLGLRSSTLGEGPSSSSGAGSSKMNKLPHWLQDVPNVPPPPPRSVPTSSTLPPAASALSLGLESEKEAPEKAKDGRGNFDVIYIESSSEEELD